jgi:hypothetical protein
MCLNCGCKMYENDMGSTDTITTETLVKAAKVMNQNAEVTLKNMQEAIEAISEEDLQKEIDKE